MFVIFLTALLGALFLYVYILNSRPSNFPKGPISLPVIGTLYYLGLAPHIKLTSMRKKWGNLFRIDFGSYRGIVLNDYKTIKEGLNIPAFNSRPPYEVIRHIRNNKNEGAIFVTGKVFEEQRKFLFDYVRIMRQDKGLMDATVLEQLEYIKQQFEKDTKHPDRKFYNTVSVAPIWTLLTGTSANANDANFKLCVELMTHIGESFSSAGAVYFMPTVCKLLPSVTGWNKVVNASNNNIDFVNSLLKPYKSSFTEDKTPTNLIEEFLLKIKMTGDSTSSFFGETGDGNLTASVFDLLLAGTETVSVGLQWFMTLMSFNPEVQRKVQSEVERVLGKDKLPSLADRLDMPYLEASIHEVLRYAALVPLCSPHATSEDAYFRGYFIPKGTVVIPNLYGVLHDEELWDNPECLMPERFLNKDGSALLKDKVALANFVFGYGTRSCPGFAMAKEQLFILCAGIFQKYQVQLDPNVPKQRLTTSLGSVLEPNFNAMIVTKI